MLGWIGVKNFGNDDDDTGHDGFSPADSGLQPLLMMHVDVG